MNKRMVLFFVFLSAGIHLFSWIGENARAAELRNCTSPVGFIFVKSGFLDREDPYLKEFAAYIGITNISESPQNPICCIRIEPLSVDPKVAGESFIMVHYDYTLIQITSREALRLLTSTLKTNQFCRSNALPVGILSSFRSVNAPETR